MSVLIQIPDLVQKTNIAVSSEHDKVLLQIGNTTLKFSYEDALIISQWLRFRAKEAKAFSGDVSRRWHVIGELHDASRGPGVTRG